MELSDGRNAVKSITVMMMLRNNHAYLEWFLPTMETMEKLYSGITFHYAFYENNSTDVTVRMLDKFVKAPVRKNRAILVSEKLDYAPSRFNAADVYHRPKYLGKLRTQFLKSLRPLKTDWTWMLDTDIYFQTSILKDMFTCAPASENIVMVTCNTKQVAKRKDNQGFVSENHYYDSYALVDSEDRMFYPMCRFPECKKCAEKWQQTKMIPYSANTSVLDVRSAYAGCVLIPSELLNNPIVEWRTTEVCFGELAMCEHVFFCDTLRFASGGGRVVVLPQVKDLYWRK